MLMKFARTAALAVAMSIGVAGCDAIDQFDSVISTVSGATVPASAAQIARASFNSAEILATGYMRLPRCKDDNSNRPVCRDPALRQRIDAAVLDGRKARAKIALMQRSNPGGAIPVASYNTLTGATDIITNLTAAYSAAVGK